MNMIKLNPEAVESILKDNQKLCFNRINEYFETFETRTMSKRKYDAKIGKVERKNYPTVEAYEDARRIPRGYTGSFFEKYSRKSDRECFDGNDVSAAISLSITGEGYWVASLLNANIDLSCFSNFPFEKCISDVPREFFDDESGISQVLAELLKINGIGLVVASKLLASKRPHLFPIFDRVVSNFFGVPMPTNKKRSLATYLGWCKSWQQVVSDPGVKKELIDIRAKISIKPNDQISPLRLLDVTFWLEGQKNETEKLDLGKKTKQNS